MSAVLAGSIPLLLLASALPMSACAPAIAGSMIVGGTVSLVAANHVHGDCGEDLGSAHARACVWVDTVAAMLAIAGIGLVGGGAALGVYAATHDP